MRKEDWLVAGAVASLVAMAVVAAGLPPVGWAADTPRVAIPALSPAVLKIASLDASVNAVAERDPGKAVTVKLSCQSLPSHYGETVPLTVHVFKMDMRAMISRSASPSAPKEVAKMDAVIELDSNGQGETSVEMPLTWTSDDANAAQTDKKAPVPSYYMVLTSSRALNEQVFQVENVKGDSVEESHVSVITDSDQPRAIE